MSNRARTHQKFAEEGRHALERMGAVGELLCNFFDRDGHLVDHPVNRRIMSFPVEKLRHAETRINASGGYDKIESLLGGIKLMGCDVLMTNEATARQLLKRGT